MANKIAKTIGVQDHLADAGMADEFEVITFTNDVYTLFH